MKGIYAIRKLQNLKTVPAKPKKEELKKQECSYDRLDSLPPHVGAMPVQYASCR